MEDQRPELPLQQLHAAADDDQAREQIDALHAELSKVQPSSDVIATHVDEIRKQPKLVALIENWFDDPRIQTFLADLSSAGL